MKVKIKKVHDAWNILHPDEFNVGDTVELDGNTVTTKSGKRFDANDLCACYGCAYPDIFEKIEQ